MSVHPPRAVRRRAFAVRLALSAAALVAALVAACATSNIAVTPGTFRTLGSQVNGGLGRAFHAAAALSNGDVLLVGGQDAVGGPLFLTQYAERLRWDFFSFEPETSLAGSSVGAVNVGRILPTLAVVPGTAASGADEVVIAGGQLTGVGYSPPPTAPIPLPWLDMAGTLLFTGGGEMYPAGVRSALAPVEIVDAGPTPVDLHGAALVAVGGDLFLIGGRDGAGAGTVRGDIRRYSPTAGTGNIAALVVDTVVALNTPRYGHTATALTGGKILVAGGWDGTGAFLSSVEIVDVSVPASPKVKAGGALWWARTMHTATALKSGTEVLIVGGIGPSSLLADTPVAEVCTVTACTAVTDLLGHTPTPRVYHSATLLGSGEVLVTGGLVETVPGSMTYTATVLTELYDPLTGEFRASPGDLAFARFGHTATAIPGGTVVVAGGLSKWGAGSAVPAAERYFPERP
ncbi:MAG: kelch motif-containing protein [Nitrospirota bacterium]|nr:kelch motif-containing protein [Nitrospirota bacterium]